jgi:hypothetical protein
LRAAERLRIQHGSARRDRRVANLLRFKIRDTRKETVVTEQIDHHAHVPAIALGRPGNVAAGQNAAIETRGSAVGRLVVK